jgi:acyl-CoA synthetase (AMP-forming)/AMP-acid ligase II
MMDNIPEHPIAFLAAENIGLTSVLVNNRLQAGEIDYILSNSEPRMMIVGERFVAGEHGADLRGLLEDRFGPGTVLVVGEPPSSAAFRSTGIIGEEANKVSRERLEETEKGLGDTPVTVIYTSGTTGQPKGAILTEKNIVFNLANWKKRLPADETRVGVVGVFFPLFHSGGMIGGICGCIIMQFTVVLADFDIENSLHLIGEHGINIMGAVAAMTALQLSHPRFDEFDYSSLEYLFMGAGPCPPEILKEINRRMGADVIIGYGLTEGTMGNLITTLQDDTEEHKLNTIGVPLPGVEVRLVDENRKEVSEGTIGEIALKGPTVFAGYLNNPDATRDVIDSEGWLHTGDLATRDPEGYYSIVGRTTEMYIRGGENVYPSGIEDVLKEHPDIMLAAVLGIPDSVMGEAGRAYIIKMPGSDLTEEDVISYCANHLADYKVPKDVVFRDMLPLTPIGKVLKKTLAEEIRQEFG